MINKILSILALFGITVTTQAENLYTFKDSNGQVLLTSIVNNGQSSKTMNHAETETLKSEKQDDGGEYYTGDVSSDIEVLKQQAQQREDRLANLAKKLSQNDLTLPQLTYYPDTQTTYQYNGSAWEMIYSDKNKKSI